MLQTAHELKSEDSRRIAALEDDLTEAGVRLVTAEQVVGDMRNDLEALKMKNEKIEMMVAQITKEKQSLEKECEELQSKVGKIQGMFCCSSIDV